MKITSSYQSFETAAPSSGVRQRLVGSTSGPEPQDGATVTLSKQSEALLASLKNGGAGMHDFARLSPREMRPIAQALYDAREIDLTQLRLLHLAAKPLGSMGAHGELVKLSAAEEAVTDNKPTDFLSAIQTQIQSLERTGGGPDFKEAARTLKELLGVLARHQQGSAHPDTDPS